MGFLKKFALASIALALSVMAVPVMAAPPSGYPSSMTAEVVGPAFGFDWSDTDSLYHADADDWHMTVDVDGTVNLWSDLHEYSATGYYEWSEGLPELPPETAVAWDQWFCADNVEAPQIWFWSNGVSGWNDATDANSDRNNDTYLRMFWNALKERNLADHAGSYLPGSVSQYPVANSYNLDLIEFNLEALAPRFLKTGSLNTNWADVNEVASELWSRAAERKIDLANMGSPVVAGMSGATRHLRLDVDINFTKVVLGEVSGSTTYHGGIQDNAGTLVGTVGEYVIKVLPGGSPTQMRQMFDAFEQSGGEDNVNNEYWVAHAPNGALNWGLYDTSDNFICNLDEAAVFVHAKGDNLADIEVHIGHGTSIDLTVFKSTNGLLDYGISDVINEVDADDLHEDGGLVTGTIYTDVVHSWVFPYAIPEDYDDGAVARDISDGHLYYRDSLDGWTQTTSKTYADSEFYDYGGYYHYGDQVDGNAAVLNQIMTVLNSLTRIKCTAEWSADLAQGWQVTADDQGAAPLPGSSYNACLSNCWAHWPNHGWFDLAVAGLNKTPRTTFLQTGTPVNNPSTSRGTLTKVCAYAATSTHNSMRKICHFFTPVGHDGLGEFKDMGCTENEWSPTNLLTDNSIVDMGIQTGGEETILSPQLFGHRWDSAPSRPSNNNDGATCGWKAGTPYVVLNYELGFKYQAHPLELP